MEKDWGCIGSRGSLRSKGKIEKLVQHLLFEKLRNLIYESIDKIEDDTRNNVNEDFNFEHSDEDQVSEEYVSRINKG